MRCRPTAARPGIRRARAQSGLVDGNYLFHAVVTDPAGNSSTTGPIKVIVDNTAPDRGHAELREPDRHRQRRLDPVTQDGTFDLSLAGDHDATA